MSRDFTYASKRNPCPCCAHDHGCKLFHDGKVWCLRINHSHDAPTGYRVLGLLRNGMGASLVPDDGFDLEEYRRKQRKQEEKRQRRLQRQLSSLSVSERDKAIRKMHSAIGLTSSARQHLKQERGLTDAQIEQGLYFSVAPHQDLPAGIPLNFPGVHWGGRSLTNRYQGIACVLFNPDGMAIGIQIRVTDDTDEGRYRWLSGQNSSHLPNGELPLTYIRPPSLKRKHPAIIEGTGFKPQLAADRLAQVVIGASGGQHAGSPKQLLAYLEAASSEGLDTSVVQIYLDAGDVVNHHVINRLATLIDLLESWGKTVQIAWWGQTTKKSPDIDELEDVGAIAYIPAKEFQPLQKFKIDAPDSTLPIEDEAPVIEPSPAAYTKYLEWEASQEQIDQLQKERRQEIWRNNFAVAAKNAWRRWKKFSPDRVIDQPFFDFPIPGPNTITAVKSPLGTGKTEWLKRVQRISPGEGWVALGYRNSLLLQSCERWGFYHLHQDEAFVLVADPKSNIACCVDSLIHFQPHHFEGKNIILDEVMSIIVHLLAGGTLKGRKDRCLELFEQALKAAKRIFILDGNLADWAVEYINNLAGDKKVTKIENKYQDPLPLNIEFLSGTQGSKRLKPNDKSPLLTLIKDDCSRELGMRPAIATDSQILAESLDKILKASGFCGIRIDSKTISESWCKEFLKNPDAWIRANQPDYLIYSPTAEGGLDISIKNYFTKQYGIFFGVLTVDSIIQMLGRIRDRNVPRVVWAAQFVRNDRETFRSPFAKVISKAVYSYLVNDSLLSIDGRVDALAVSQKLQQLIANSTDEHFRVACIVAAIANYEKANLRECLLETLERGNNDLLAFALEEDRTAKHELGEATNAVKNQNALDIFNAKDLDIKLASQMEGIFGADWSTRCAVMKAKLKAILPGIESTPHWSVEFIRRVSYDDRQFINRCELFWLLHHREVAQRIQQEQWAWLSKFDKTFLKGINSRYSPVWALLETEFPNLLDPNREWREDSPELVEFRRRFKASQRLQTALGMNVGKSTPMHWFYRVLKRVGLNTKTKQLRFGEKRIRVYWIDPDTWNDVERHAVLATLPTRWKQYLDESYPEPEFELENYAQTEVESVTRSANNSIQLGGLVTDRFPSQKEKIPEEHLEDVREVVSWVEIAVAHGLEGLQDVMHSVRSYLAQVPQARRWLWRCINQSVKDALGELSPQDYRFLAAN